MSIDIYQPRTMAAALKEMKPPRAWLRNTFFGGPPRLYTTERIDVDEQIGARRLAPFVNPNGPGKQVDRIGFSTTTVTPPLVAPKRSITVPDIQTRLPGEHAYAGMSGDERAAELLGTDLAELDEDIARREEWMCAKVLFNSEVDIVGEGVNYTIEFARDAALSIGTLAGSDAWSHADSDPYGDFEEWVDTSAKLSGINPEIGVLGSSAWAALRNNTKFKAQLDLLRMELGRIAPAQRPEGVRYVGTLAGLGLDLFVYNEWYIDPDTGAQDPMVPAKKVLLGSANLRTEMRYGAVGVATGDGASASIGLVSATRVPESWVAKEPAVRWLKVSARPLPVPIQNRFLTAQVIA